MAARRPAPKRVSKPKTIKLGKKAVQSLNLKYYGREPSLDDPKKWTRAQAYSWYNYNCDSSMAKDFLAEYLADHNHKHAAIISKIDEKVIYGYGSTACWIARMLDNGFQFDSAVMKFFNDKIDYIVYRSNKIKGEKAEAREEIKAVELTVPVDKVQEKYNDVFNFLDSCLWERNYLSPFDYFKSEGVGRPVIQKIYNRFKPYLDELNELLAPGKKDVQLIEYYSKWKVSDVKKELTYIKRILDDCESVLEVKKAERKPRQKKVIPVESRIRSLNYQKTDLTMNLTSFNPTKIFEAKEIWTYNTKYNILTVYRTDTEFDIKGTTLLNYDPTKSVSKRVGSKYGAESVKLVMATNKIGLRSLMEKLKGSVQDLKGRIGENTVLLKYTT